MSDYMFVFQEWDMLRANTDTSDDRVEKTTCTPTIRGQTYNAQLQEARIRKRLTISELAKRVGVTSRTMSMYENGSEMPPVDIVEKINQLLEIE